MAYILRRGAAGMVPAIRQLKGDHLVWLPKDVVAQCEARARFYYVGVADTHRWNEHRREGELRLLTGWAWVAKDGTDHRQGFKTMTVAYRDAYYSLIKKVGAPSLIRPRLRVVANNKKAAA